MIFLNDIDQISECIKCPNCKNNSLKDWIVERLEYKGRPKIRKSQVYFKCITCKHYTEIFDEKLIKFVDNQLNNQ